MAVPQGPGCGQVTVGPRIWISGHSSSRRPPVPSKDVPELLLPYSQGRCQESYSDRRTEEMSPGLTYKIWFPTLSNPTALHQCLVLGRRSGKQRMGD